MIRPWELVNRVVRLECGIFRVEEKVFRSPRTGVERPFVSAAGTDWVNVIALTNENEVVLVRQFRHSRECITLEIPGGMVDPGEEPREAASRELREETGYAGSEPRLLGSVEPNPAILDLLCHTYLVDGATLVGPPQPDETEDIEVSTVPLGDIPAMMRQGTIIHALVIAAFSWLELSLGGYEALAAKAPR